MKSIIPTMLSRLRMCGSAALLSVLAGPLLADQPTSDCKVVDDHDYRQTLALQNRVRLSRDSNKNEVNELSGLVVQEDVNAPGGFWYWTVSDAKNNVYRVGANGHIGSDAADKIDLGSTNGEDLEGIALFGQDLLVLQEGAVTVVNVSSIPDRAPKSPGLATPLSTMIGYDTVTDPRDYTQTTLAHYMSASSSNDRLEGITYHVAARRVFIIKEKNPGLLIEVNTATNEIASMQVLNCGDFAGQCPQNHPFPDRIAVSDDNTVVRDFSGVTMGPTENQVWIASDKAQAVFLYDVVKRKYDTFRLLTFQGDTPQCIEQAEGVTAGANGLLYVTQDKPTMANSYIYTFKYTDTRTPAN